MPSKKKLPSQPKVRHYGEATGYNHSYGFVFSDKIEDHMFGGSTDGKRRKQQYLKEKKKFDSDGVN